MRKLTALLLTLALVIGLVPAAFAKTYTLDIYWIANVNSDKPYNDIAAEVNDYLADKKADPTHVGKIVEAAIGKYLTDADIQNSRIRLGVEKAINEYLAELHKAKKIKDIEVCIHLIPWDPSWTEQAIGALLDDQKIDLLFTADWEGYVQEILAKKLTPLGDLLESDGQGILETLSEDFLEGVRYNQVIYGIPTNKELCVPTGLIVNKTAAELIGWDPDKDPVKTTEELEPWLAKFREKFPGRYPYLMEKGRWADEPWVPDWIDVCHVQVVLAETAVIPRYSSRTS